MSSKSEIIKFYAGKSVFITGATGFVGKALIEKLLRCCPNIKNIFILVRPKKGVEVNERIKEIIENPLFDTIKSTNPGIFSKIIPICGDIGLDKLGISKEDQQILIDEISIVIHSAATVKFDEEIKMAINLNTNGTIRMIELSKKMKNLKAFVYISTVYANCERSEIDEILYPLHTNPQKLLKDIEKLSDETANKMTNGMLKATNKPNTYIFTKSITENILNEERINLPVVIVRPSIITSSWKEPVKGWLDKSSPLLKFVLGIGKGVLRSMLIRDVPFDAIPIDTLANCILASAWFKTINNENEAKNEVHIYNCGSGKSGNFYPFTYKDATAYAYNYLIKNPFQEVFWYPTGSNGCHSNKIVYNFYCILYHNIPAFLVDFGLFITGNKPVVCKIYKKVHKALETFSFFSTRSWDIKTNNMMNLQSNMCLEDQKILNLDLKEINWIEYTKDYNKGVSLYILKEDPKDIQKARKHLKKLLWIRNIVNSILISILFYALYYLFINVF